MCCRLSISPYDAEVAIAILGVGLFKPIYLDQAEKPTTWERTIEEEGTVVRATTDASGLHLSIAPSISVYDHHHGKRLAASVYFEIACKYAEKVNGRIVQFANVAGCATPDGPNQLVLAEYPDSPMLWQNVCAGFQAELLTPMEEGSYD